MVMDLYSGNEFVPNPETLFLLRECVPSEIRHDIFRMVFETERPRELISIVSISGKLDLHYKDQRKTKQHQAFERKKLWLQPNVVGQQLAFEAAQALYKSKVMFAVQAEHLTDFLRQCPLSCLPNPGSFICRLNLFVDEDQNFTGDGPCRQDLRMADWENLTKDWCNRRQTRSMHGHTAQMRRCWKAISMMPRLTHFECRVMPVGGKQSAAQITSWEVRDILPALWYLWKKGVSVRVYFRVWEKMDSATATMLQGSESPTPDHENPSFFESSVDVGICLPFLDTYMAPPNEKDRLRARRVLQLGHHKRLPTFAATTPMDMFFAIRGDIYTFHRVRFYDALAGFAKRLFPCTDFQLHSGDHCNTFLKPYSMDDGISRIC